MNRYILALLSLPTLADAAAPAKASDLVHISDDGLVLELVTNGKRLHALEDEFHDNAENEVSVPHNEVVAELGQVLPFMVKDLLPIVADYGRPRLTALPEISVLFRRSMPDALQEQMDQEFDKYNLLLTIFSARGSELSESSRKAAIDFSDNDVFETNGYSYLSHAGRKCFDCAAVNSSIPYAPWMNLLEWHAAWCKIRNGQTTEYGRIEGPLRDHLAHCLYMFACDLSSNHESFERASVRRGLRRACFNQDMDMRSDFMKKKLAELDAKPSLSPAAAPK